VSADALRALVGREAVYEAPEELGRAAIRYFALAVGDDNPLYFDDEYAAANGYPSVVAPPTLICETNQFVRGPRDADGYLTQMLAPEIDGMRQMRGGNEYEFARPVLPSDRVTISWRIAEVKERGELFFVVSEATYTNQDGDVLARNRETIVYQPRGGS
jgi:acyl dehydratase